MLLPPIPQKEMVEEMTEKVMEETNEDVCERCGTSDAKAPHTCPYKEDIHGSSMLCNCCEACQHECWMDR